ncbi:DNA mismatch repair endonuclease MutL [Thermaerobacter subterraneus]|uniref:DNA mismatch repair protein MutL n=1 Tax=Thermaerobacter subterraneus DSM 13965 TaxID=867903 RepID=K6NYH2_9FIRM|nr:DNA mismatch repair endonuclease MutL [Thermaerobacter subterraneus]EKP93930.1 DNA mismatch repair protein MutL [Thermaerobacter subterraneus DSM 13965]
MGRIRRLDPQVINQIAAGEVVERPASVVKELVENSLDAGARRIRVDVAEGGLRSITVSDDGCGMDPDDALLAVERHATSKISRLDDLARAGTLGFRGEALAAMASVARLELVTRPPAAEGGFRVVVEGGAQRSAGPWASPPGTRVTVRDLFFNTPARRKHLKGPVAEFGRIADVVTAHALARPDVRFELWHNGREVLRTSGSGDPAVAVLECFGPDVATGLIPVAAAGDACRIEGYVGAPRIARASRAWQFFSINRRPVQVPSLRFSLENAYRHLLPARRYPVAVLALTVPGEEVDVNVHPAKLEVRLVRERAVASLLYRAVESALAERDPLRPAAPGPFYAPSPGNPGERFTPPKGPWGNGEGPWRPGSPRWVRGASWAVRPGSGRAPEVASGGAAGGTAEAAAEAAAAYEGATAAWLEVFRRGEEPHGTGAARGPRAGQAGTPGETFEPAPQPPGEGWGSPGARRDDPAGGTGSPAAGTGSLAREEEVPDGARQPGVGPAGPTQDARDLLLRLEPLGQVAGTYLACAGPDGLYVVDQHAAHERIYFERFLAQGAGQAGVPAQLLAVPVVLDLPASEYALLLEQAAAVARMGFQIEPFGPRSVAVRAVPAALADRPAPSLLADLLARLLAEAVRGGGEEAPVLDTDRAARILAACKAAIKAGDRLHPQEMAQLLADLARCRQPYACPHGRPTVIRVGVDELERRFGRRGGG